MRVAIRVQSAATDTQWIRVHVEGVTPDSAMVAIDRKALESIIQHDPRPPEIILDVLCERAVKRMPIPNGPDGARLITPHNLSLVWPR
jgi:Uma2 family endonuclease